MILVELLVLFSISIFYANRISKQQQNNDLFSLGLAEREVIEVKKIKAIVLALAFLMMLCAVAPVFAIGPTKAAEIGHNPNLGINPTTQKTYINTPCGKSGLDRITWLDNQMFLYLNVSNVKGMMNNALIADIDTVNGMNANPEDYENKWVYLSGENEGNAYEGHGMFYWWITSPIVGFPADQAEASILARNPDGGFVKINYVGP